MTYQHMQYYWNWLRQSIQISNLLNIKLLSTTLQILLGSETT